LPSHENEEAFLFGSDEQIRTAACLVLIRIRCFFNGILNAEIAFLSAYAVILKWLTHTV
jgi:hypothetical protein